MPEKTELLINIPDILTGLITAIIIGLFVIYSKKIRYKFNKHKYISKEIEAHINARYSQNFVPNRIGVHDSVHDDGIKYFYENLFITEGSPLNIIIAPTGVGKTTFLANLYLKREQLGRQVKVAFGRMYHSDSLKMIQNLIDNNIAKDTVLLMDALDELTIPAAESPQAYWSQFLKDYHKFINEKAKYFKKVVFTVREQFLQTNELFNQSVQVGMDTYPPKYIYLLPFNDQQQDKYLDLKYSKADQSALLQDLKWIAFKMRERKLSMVEIPLVLNYLEEIFKVYTPNNQEYFFTSYNILNIIVESWLTREESKGLAKEQLRNFCTRLAFEIARQSKPGLSKLISAKALIEFESSVGVLQDFSGWGDRSLLIKDTVGEGLRFGFINDTILEFFLVLAINARPEKELEVPLEEFDIALQLLVAQRWPELKKKGFPEIIGANLPDSITPQDPRVTRILFYSFIDRSNHPLLTYEDLLKWSEYFDQLFQSPKVQERMSKDRFLTKTLEIVDPNWQRQVNGLFRFAITNFNFWDSETGSPKKGVEKALLYLSDYIEDVLLYEISMNDEDLSCIKYASNISSISILKVNLTIRTMEYITASTKSLESICIHTCNITDEYLAVFSDCNNLAQVTLSTNDIIGSGLHHFSNSAKSLTKIMLIENQIQDEYLAAFHETNKLEALLLNSNKLTGKGLYNFSNNTGTLKELWLGDNEIEDQYVGVFSTASKLEELSVFKTKLTKAGLLTFLASKDTLRMVNFYGNNISEADQQELKSRYNNPGIIFDISGLSTIDINSLA
ncbi:hypothetical protein [Pedobacter heparinus]|uniref:nSTAND3 domain-containing NTPase n=1 Tax=Pedobacter heparinus TaxID=984 RepID=UPI0029305CE4|nr:hypothetical protein [Pedobacter heparinus]